MIISLLVSFTAIPAGTYAYEHGYKKQTDITYALARHDLAVYYDQDASEENLIEYVPSFTGVRVIDSEDSWVQVEYTRKKKTRTGWATKGDFDSDCLVYDGRDKQIAANGNYTIFWNNLDPDAIPDQSGLDTPSEDDPLSSSIPVTLTYMGNDSYRITRSDTGMFLWRDTLPGEKAAAQRWGSILKSGLFNLSRDGDRYCIQDSTTRHFLNIDEHGLLVFQEQYVAPFRLILTDNKVLGETTLRVFCQFDADWGKDYYGKGKNSDPQSNNFTTSACGIFAPLNAIYTLTGQFIDPHLLADYAVKKEYRIEGNGTDDGFFRAAAEKFGHDYGFEFDGEGGSIDDLKRMLKKGDVAIGHVPGHYVAIVDYNPKTKKYLLLDPHYLPKRETCPYGDWVSRRVLEESDNLSAYMLYFYKKLDK